MEEKNFAVQTGQQVNDQVKSKEDETDEKKKALAQKDKKSDAAKPDKQLAAVEKVVTDDKADKVAAKIVEKHEEKPKGENKKQPEVVLKVAQEKDANLAKKADTKKVPTASPLGKSAKLQTAVADLHETSDGHVDEPLDMKDDDGTGELPKSMD